MYKLKSEYVQVYHDLEGNKYFDKDQAIREFKKQRNEACLKEFREKLDRLLINYEIKLKQSNDIFIIRKFIVESKPETLLEIYESAKKHHEDTNAKIED